MQVHLKRFKHKISSTYFQDNLPKVNVCKRCTGDNYQSQLNWLVITADSWWCTGKMPFVHASVSVPHPSL